MHGRVQLAVNHADGFMPFFLIPYSDRRYDQYFRVIEHPCPEGQGKTMLFPVRGVFGRVKFDLYALCILHIIAWHHKAF